MYVKSTMLNISDFATAATARHDEATAANATANGPTAAKSKRSHVKGALRIRARASWANLTLSHWILFQPSRNCDRCLILCKGRLYLIIHKLVLLFTSQFRLATNFLIFLFWINVNRWQKHVARYPHNFPIFYDSKSSVSIGFGLSMWTDSSRQLQQYLIMYFNF